MLTVRNRRRNFTGHHRSLVAVALVTSAAAIAAGCKSGSWGSKPSWWSFGGSAPNESLAAAPTFKSDVPKPSEAAKPYPTTETPQAYELSEATRTEPPAGPATAGGLVEPASVTYGTTRPASPATAPATATAGGQQPAAAPQVGPYASLSQPSAPAASPASQAVAVDPAEAATAGLAAAPAFNQERFGTASPGQSAARGYATPPPPVAEPRGEDRWASATPPSSAAPPAGSGSRYSQHSSRFSGGYEPPPQVELAPPASAPSAELSAGPASFADPEAGSAGLATAPRPTPAPLGPPAIEPAASSAAPATPAEQVLPGSLTPPQRRPDPGYRPGGTSSYRPNRAILAEEPAAGSEVIPAAFQATPGGSAEGL